MLAPLTEKHRVRRMEKNVIARDQVEDAPLRLHRMDEGSLRLRVVPQDGVNTHLCLYFFNELFEMEK